MSDSARRYLQSGILAVWGGVCVSFVASGRVSSYLHPSFHGWTLACGVVLLGLAAALLLFPAQTAGCCDDHGHQHGHEPHDCGGAHVPGSLRGQILSAAILVVPLLVAIPISPSQFGAVAVMNRGLAQSIVDLPGITAPTPFMEPPLPTADGSPGEPGPPADTGSYLARNEHGEIIASTVDLLYAAHLPEIRSEFENQEVEIVGQFFPARGNNPDGDRFSLVRMFVLCCAADARPVAITVRAPGTEDFPKMSWIKVGGTVRFPIEGGERVPVIDARSVEPSEPPAETFLY
jgi:uncharacterized repeat protein (TIGR03943 family)